MASQADTMPDATADAIPDTSLDDATAAGDDADLALALGMTPTLPPLPSDFKQRVLAAYAGDLQAIQEMRAIGDMVPPYMQAAFAEMVEELVAS